MVATDAQVTILSMQFLIIVIRGQQTYLASHGEDTSFSCV